MRTTQYVISVVLILTCFTASRISVQAFSPVASLFATTTRSVLRASHASGFYGSRLERKSSSSNNSPGRIRHRLCMLEPATAAVMVSFAASCFQASVNLGGCKLREFHQTSSRNNNLNLHASVITSRNATPIKELSAPAFRLFGEEENRIVINREIVARELAREQLAKMSKIRKVGPRDVHGALRAISERAALEDDFPVQSRLVNEVFNVAMRHSVDGMDALTHGAQSVSASIPAASATAAVALQTIQTAEIAVTAASAVGAASTTTAATAATTQAAAHAVVVATGTTTTVAHATVATTAGVAAASSAATGGAIAGNVAAAMSVTAVGATALMSPSTQDARDVVQAVAQASSAGLAEHVGAKIDAVTNAAAENLMSVGWQVGLKPGELSVEGATVTADVVQELTGEAAVQVAAHAGASVSDVAEKFDAAADSFMLSLKAADAMSGPALHAAQASSAEVAAGQAGALHAAGKLDTVADILVEVGTPLALRAGELSDSGLHASCDFLDRCWAAAGSTQEVAEATSRLTAELLAMAHQLPLVSIDMGVVIGSF